MALNFPVFASGDKPDSSKFEETVRDNTMREDVEGGYTYTRPRTTRRLRRAWKITFTNLSDADKITLFTFYNDNSGGALSWNWVNPQNGVTYLVRFKGEITARFTGVTGFHRWDCSFEIEQV